MSDEFAVAKWGQAVELAEAPCGRCRQPMLYNLTVPCVVHAETAVDPCDEPWPFEPRPQWVKDAIVRAEADFPGWPDGYLLTEEEALPQTLTGHDRREAFAAADRIATGGVTT